MLHFLIDGSNRSILPLTRLPSLSQVPFCPVMVEQVESKYSHHGSACLGQGRTKCDDVNGCCPISYHKLAKPFNALADTGKVAII